ncbi:hypothetical protein [Blastococcus xanthinilyticus]|nr:hypothetical protein [Blastococcus xanthinilyticus]
MRPARRVLVVGGGRNGLVAACYLPARRCRRARAGAVRPAGGGAQTEEVIPGHRFDSHSVAHNIIQATGITEELDLAGVGLAEGD